MTHYGRSDGLSDNVSRRGFVAGAAALTGGAALLAACGGGSDEKSQKGAGESDARTAEGITGDGKQGGAVRVAFLGGGTSESLNPSAMNALAEFAGANQIYEPLVRFNPKGSIDYLLAEEITPNSDFSKWTIRLKPDVMFHDGKRLTVDDAIYTFRVMTDEKAEFITYRTNYQGVKPNSFRKIDPLTFSVELEAPNSYFAQQLGGTYGHLYPEGTTDWDSPNGTGPFKFDSWNRGERRVHTAFDEYREGRPKLDTVEILSINEADARLNALLSGEVDAISAPPIARIPEIEGNSKFQLIESAGNVSPAIAMECTPTGSGPSLVNKVEVRQAMKHLVDRQQIIDTVYGGRARLMNDVLVWYDPNYNTSLPQREYDPEKARSLLKKAGVSPSDLSSVTYGYGDILASFVEMSEVFLASVENGGVKLNGKKGSADSYYTTLYGQKPMFGTWFNTRTSYEHLVNALISKPVYPETRPQDPRLDKLATEIARTGDKKLQKELLWEAQKICWEDGGYIFPANPNFLIGASSKVLNLRSSIAGEFDAFNFREVALEA
jgi:peptide/nickel transport system substrate-binding protein